MKITKEEEETIEQTICRIIIEQLYDEGNIDTLPQCCEEA